MDGESDAWGMQLREPLGGWRRAKGAAESKNASVATLPGKRLTIQGHRPRSMRSLLLGEDGEVVAEMQRSVFGRAARLYIAETEYRFVTRRIVRAPGNETVFGYRWSSGYPHHRLFLNNGEEFACWISGTNPLNGTAIFGRADSNLFVVRGTRSCSPERGRRQTLTWEIVLNPSLSTDLEAVVLLVFLVYSRLAQSFAVGGGGA